MLADIKDGTDTRMAECRERPRFALEAPVQTGVRGELLVQDLEGNHAAQSRVAPEIDLTHPASAERFPYLVRTEVAPWRQPLAARLGWGTRRHYR